MRLRFGHFRVEPTTGELWKEDRRVRLKPQPARVLALLALHRGAIVTREQIKKELWGDDTFVDFDLGINSCIRQIRIALGDDSEAPRFVQTLPNRGYRLLAAPQEKAEPASSAKASASSPPPSGWRQSLPWVVAGLSLLAALILGARHGEREVRVFRAEISAPPGTRFHLESADPGPPALSPDGSKLAFCARDVEGMVRLFVRSLDASVALELPGTEGAQYPFWSPDGRWVGFFAEGKLKKIAATGGPVQAIADAPNGKGATWSQRDVIVYAPEASGPLFQVSAAGAKASTTSVLDDARGDNSHRHPWFLPDGRRYLYLARNSRGSKENIIVIGSLDGDDPVPLIRSPAGASYAAGHLLFVRGNTLMAQPLDANRLVLSGEARQVERDVFVIESAAKAYFSTSRLGELVYLEGPGTLGSAARLEWAGRSGEREGFLGDIGAFEYTAPSPDGRLLAIPIFGSAGTYDLWTHDVARGDRTRFTFGDGSETHPVWSPDGATVVFESRTKHGSHRLSRKTIDGLENEEVLLSSDEDIRQEHLFHPSSWSSDGRYLAYHSAGDIWILPVREDDDPHRFTDAASNELWGMFSPDVRWMAYQSDESGRAEVYVSPFPGPGRKWQISKEGGSRPFWTRGGREIVYQSLEGRVMAVAVELRENALVIRERLPLFEMPRAGRMRTDDGEVFYSPIDDGDRFIRVRVLEEENSRPLTLVVNWPVALAR